MYVSQLLFRANYYCNQICVPLRQRGYDIRYFTRSCTRHIICFADIKICMNSVGGVSVFPRVNANVSCSNYSVYNTTL